MSELGRRKFLLGLIPAGIALAGLSGSYILPLEHEAIDYAHGPIHDAVSRLQPHPLRYEDEFGYLRSVLQELNISPKSQVLVFSKTSFQASRIAPRTPRALYFNDNVAVGFVRTGEVLEVTALDPKQGIIFYTVDQERSSHPGFERRDVCLQCHQSGATLGIPGLFIRSVHTDRNGVPILSDGAFVTDHRSPLKERWGGWYVSGDAGTQTHMGDTTTNYDPGAYLTPYSDIVALMTLEHQTQMDNLMIRVGFEARIALDENRATNKSLGEPEEQIRPSIQHRIDTAADELFQYMTFRDEAKLTAPVKGASGFAEEFSQRGLRDSRGRSFRDFDLKTRLFRFPCSYMIYSEAFDGMPRIVRDRLYQRLLKEADPAVLEILRDTKPSFQKLYFSAN